jgi:hypothetical protein
MMMDGQMKDRAATEANEILDQFERLDSLGAFVGQEVREQKAVFLIMCLVNFARREHLRGAHESSAPRS